MTRKLMALGTLALALASASTRPARGDITAVSSSGPGGTVSNLGITTTFSANDSVQFDANFTSLAPIDLTLTVNGPGMYFVGAPFGFITNSTSEAFPSFYAYMVGPPAGTLFDEASWQDAVFSNGVSFLPPFPNTTEILFSGPPGLGVGDTTSIGVGFQITATGTNTLDIVLSPVPVPEPSSLVLGLIGAVTGLGYGSSRTLRLRGRGGPRVSVTS